MTGTSVGRRHHHRERSSMQLSFDLDLKIEQPIDQISDISGNLTIRSDGIKGTNRIPYYGITLSDEKFFILFGTFSKEDEIDYNWARSFFRNHSKHTSTAISLNNRTFYFNHPNQIPLFFKEYPNSHIAFRIVTLSFKIFPQISMKTEIHSNPFNLPNFSKGILYEGNEFKMHVDGIEYDSTRYSIETRLYLILLSFSFLLSFYSWKSLNKYSNTQSHVLSISLMSLISIFAFDFSVCFNFNIIATVNDCFMPPNRLSFFLFISHVILYVAYQFPILYRIFKQQSNSFFNNLFYFFLLIFVFFLSYKVQFSSTQNIDIAQQKPISHKYVHKHENDFKKILIDKFHSLKISNLISNFICLSQFTPQIIKNMIKSQNKGINMKFIVFIGISRICLFLYRDIYKDNIYEFETNQNFYSLSSILIFVQILVLVFQNCFGSFFFLPKLIKPKTFNYQATRPKEGEICSICRDVIGLNEIDTAVTPCGHAFHLSCLSRWMEEQQLCPICRAEIPPITPSK